MWIFTQNSFQANLESEKKIGLSEIVNGSSVLPELLFQKLKAYDNFQYLDKTRVTGLNQTNKKVSLFLTERKI